MGHQLYNHPRQLNLSTSLAILPGAKAYFYVSGTSTPATVYQNSTLTTPHASPVVANASGIFAPIYLDSSVLYKVEIQDTNGAVLSGYPVDPCNDLLPQSGNTLTQVTGTNTIEGTLSPDQALVAGLEVTVIPVATNTGAVTLELNSSGSVLDVLNNDGTACIGGELAVGIPAKLILDSGADDWNIINPANSRLLPTSSKSGNYTVVSADRGTALIYAGTGGHTFTIPDIATGAVYKVYNGGTGTLTIAAGSGITTIAWFNGSGTVGTGSRTLGVAASASLHQILDGANKNIFIDGTGIT